MKEKNEGLGDWVQEHFLSVIVLGIIFLLVQEYPIRPGSFATYRVIIPALLIIGFCVTPSCRRSFASTFEGLNYIGRITMGAVPAVVLFYFVVAISLIPPSQPPAQVARPEDPGSSPPVLVFAPTIATPTIEPPPPAKAKSARVKPRRPRVRVDEVLADTTAPEVEPPPPVPLPVSPTSVRVIR